MLYRANEVIDAGFLEKTKNGLLFIYDEMKKTTHLGWITEAKLTGEGIKINLGKSIVQKHDTTRWDLLDLFSFEVRCLNDYNALGNCGGFHCTHSGLQGPTFRIYPTTSIPIDFARDHATLVQYGDAVS